MRMAKILIIIMLAINLSASNKIQIQELVALASESSKVPIVLDKSLDSEIYIYYQSELNRNTINEILNEVLKNNNLRFERHEQYYYLTSIKEEKSLNRLIKINYLNELEIKELMKFADIKYSYINNKVLFSCLNSKFREVKKIFKNFDIAKKQKKMRITVLETNINKLKEFGVNYKLSGISSNIFNMSIGNVVAAYGPKEASRFGLDIKAMAKDGITKLITNPVMTIRDKSLTKFNITRTIPVLKSTSEIIDTNTSVVENIEYMSFGIKVDVKPIINGINNDLDLVINLQDILSNIDNKPETSDKLLSQKVIIKDNQTYVLSGFKKSLKVTSDTGVPILKDVPFFGYFFKWESKEDIEIMLQIVIEIFDEDKLELLK